MRSHAARQPLRLSVALAPSMRCSRPLAAHLTYPLRTSPRSVRSATTARNVRGHVLRPEELATLGCPPTTAAVSGVEVRARLARVAPAGVPRWLGPVALKSLGMCVAEPRSSRPLRIGPRAENKTLFMRKGLRPHAALPRERGPLRVSHKKLFCSLRPHGARDWLPQAPRRADAARGCAAPSCYRPPPGAGAVGRAGNRLRPFRSSHGSRPFMARRRGARSLRTMPAPRVAVLFSGRVSPAARRHAAASGAARRPAATARIAGCRRVRVKTTRQDRAHERLQPRNRQYQQQQYDQRQEQLISVHSFILLRRHTGLRLWPENQCLIRPFAAHRVGKGEIQSTRSGIADTMRHVRPGGPIGRRCLS